MNKWMLATFALTLLLLVMVVFSFFANITAMKNESAYDGIVDSMKNDRERAISLIRATEEFFASVDTLGGDASAKELKNAIERLEQSFDSLYR